MKDPYALACHEPRGGVSRGKKTLVAKSWNVGRLIPHPLEGKERGWLVGWIVPPRRLPNSAVFSLFFRPLSRSLACFCLFLHRYCAVERDAQTPCDLSWHTLSDVTRGFWFNGQGKIKRTVCRAKCLLRNRLAYSLLVLIGNNKMAS